ncbi:MAG: tandem-95 repeat protein [Sphingobacteriales bacterium]|nr:MAG: tandem-95 repeat protein [Sphingobacteriales bacterium]
MSKRLTLTVYILALALITTIWSYAQISNPSTYDLRFNNGQGGCGSSTYCIDIQIKASTGAPDFALGSHTIWFNYNKSVVNTPAYSALNFNSATTCSIAGVVNYNPYLSTSFNFSETGSEGEANFTTLLNSFTAGFECPVVSAANWVTMGTVCFNVVNASGNPNLYFSTEFTLINMSNNQPQHNQGNLGTLNSLSGSGSAGNPGTATFSNNYVCQGESINFSANGYSANSGFYTGLMVTNNAAVNSSAGFLAATKYLATGVPTASASNTPPNGTGFPVNTPLYVYSFIGSGNGSILQINPSCFSISPPAGPFVVLQNIITSPSNYACLGGGNAALNIVAAGGMPAYNSGTEKFNISVQNATYSGPSLVSNNQIVSITVTNGLPWTVTFTDSDGCQGVATGTFIEANVCGVCSANAGSVTVSKQYVCWNESISISASGYNFGNPSTGYVGLLVTPDASFSDLMNDEKYGLYAGATASHINNDIAEINQTLYAHSFIGEGNPFSYNPSCFDLSAPSSSFVLLGPIYLNGNNQFTYVCNANQTATIALAPTGGMPAYSPANEKFTVTVSGSATYSGPSQINNGQSVNIIIANGAWSVSFTDSKGCSYVLNNTFNSAVCGTACSVDAGVASRSKNFVCWGDQISFSATGYTLGVASSYVGLAVSTNGGLTSLTGASLSHLFLGPNTVFTNNQLNSLNQPLYLYSFIGEGAPLGSFNPNCTDLSSPTASFVLLHQVVANKSAYVCAGGGATAQVGVAASGGMPLYQAGQLFTVSVNNATYTGPTTVTNGTSITITVNNGALWSVTFTDSQGCSATISDTFNAATVCPTCTAQAGSDQTICETSTTLAAVSAPVGGSGVWSVVPGAGTGTFANSSNPATTVSGLSLGLNKLVWSVTQPACPIVRDTVHITVLSGAACGCCQDFSALVSTENAGCGLSNGSISVEVSGGAGNYSGSIINAITGTAVANPQTLPSGIYQITITDTGCGCSPITQIVQVYEDEPDYGVQTSVIHVNDCEDINSGQICFNFAGGGTPPYSVSLNGETYGSYNTGSHCIQNLSPGNYDILISDANDCSKTLAPVTIMQTATCDDCSDTDMLVQSTVLPTSCEIANGQICLTVSGGAPPYTLSGGTVLNEGQASCLTGLQASIYNFTITDSNGCIANHSATVMQPASVNVVSTVQNAGCGSANGSFCLTISGGTGTYQVYATGYEFGTFLNNQQKCAGDLPPGLYVLSITDEGTGCSVTETVGIGQQNNNILTNLQVTPSTCSSSGGVCLTFTGGNAPYSVSGVAAITGSFGQGQERCFGGIAPGTYNFTVTDNNGCSKNGAFSIVMEASSVNITATTGNATCQSPGSVCITVGGGTPPYTASGVAGINSTFTNGVQQCFNLLGNTYTLTLTDANGCVGSKTFTINQTNNTINVNLTSTSAGCAGLGGVCVSFNGGTAPYTITGLTMLNGNYNQNQQQCVSGLAAGTYNFTVTDAQGCSKQHSFNITGASSGISVSVQSDNPGCTNSDGEVCFTISGGTPPFQITGSSGANYGTGFGNGQHCIQGFSEGNYSFNIIDGMGCSVTANSILQITDDCNNPNDCETVLFDCSPAGTVFNLCPDFCLLTGSYEIILVNTGGNGTATITNSGTCMSYQPQTGFAGLNTIYLIACSSPTVCETIALKLTVGACGQAPTAVADAFAVNQGTTTCLNVLANDYDVDGSSFSVGTFTPPLHGTVSLNSSTGELCYQSDSGYSGSDSFTYTACDATGCNTATVFLTVESGGGSTTVCTNPANSGTICTQPVTPVSICVSFCNLNASAAITEVNSTFDSGLSIQAYNCIQYTPLPGQTGGNTITIKACDNTGNCELIYMSVQVDAECGNQTCSNPENLCTTPMTPIEFCVEFCNISGNTTIQEINTTYNCGILITSDNCILYTPLPGFMGTEMMELVGCNSTGQCETIVIPILVAETCEVDPEPCINPDNLCTTFITPIEFCVNFCDLNESAAITEVHPTYDCGIVLLGDNCVQYTPLPGYVGIDVIAVTGCDDTGACQTILVSVNVAESCEPVNDPPVAIDDTATTPFNTPVTITVLVNDSDPNGDPITITTFTQPTSGGTVELIGNNLVFTPTPGFSGTAVFNYTICDPYGLCDEAIVTVIIEPEPPCINPDNLCTEPMTPLEICVVFCDLNETAQVTGITATYNCGLMILPVQGCIQYIPLPGFLGPELLAITGCDNTGACQTIYVNVIVQANCDTPVNNPPVAVDDSATTPENTPVEIIVLTNDSDPDGDVITITASTPPAHGTITLNANGDGFIYTPDNDYTGFDTFTYQICDPEGLCDIAVVTIEIISDCPNGPPVFVCTEPMVPTIICPEFCNISPEDGITIISVTATFNCGINLLTDGCFQYTPLPGYTGQDSLIIIGCTNLGVCDTTVVYSFVSCAAPIAFPDIATTPNTQSVSIDVLANDIGICSDDILVTVVTQPSDGTASVNANNEVVYTPPAGFTGVVVFTYTVCDLCSASACDNTTVTVTVTGGGPVPEVDPQPDVVQTPFNTPIQINVLSNDLGANLIISSFTQPDNGTVTFSPDGTQVIYTPNTGFSGVDYFFYTVCDSVANVCETTIVSVTVLPESNPNLPPTANNDFAVTPVNTPIQIPVLVNDSDPEGQLLTVTAVTTPTNGTASIVDNQVLYTPNPGFTGLDSFLYVICDTGTPVLCDTAMIGVTVGVPPYPNNPPIAVPDEAFTGVNTPVTINILGNDFDPDGDPITVSIGSDPANGTVILNTDNTATYTPNPGFTGTDYFTYIICDDGMPSLCDTTWVTIQVSSTGVPPVAADDDICIGVNEPVEIFVLNNDFDADGGLMLITLITSPVNGQAFVSVPGNSIAYIPSVGFEGVDVFDYQICDPTGLCDTATVTVYVSSGISLQPDIYFVTQNGSVLMPVLENDFGAQLTITGFTQPAHGIVIADGNTLAYLPNADYIGQDYFFYTACDCAGECQETIVALIVIPANVGNQPPIANNDYASTPINTPVDIPVLDNDSDPNGDPIVVTGIFDAPDPVLVGTPEIAPDGLSVIFTPVEGFEGCTMFGYIVCDNGNPALCDSAYVAVGVGNTGCLNLPPLAQPDTVSTTLNIPVIISVLDNDSDPNGDLITVTVATVPLNGTTVINPDNTVTYTPNTGYLGTDYFVYVICDDGSPSLCDTSYVIVNIVPEAVLAQPDIFYTNVNVPLTDNILVNDFGDGIFVAGVSFPPENGTLSIDNAITGVITYTPNTDFVGTDYFEYVICNSPTNCDTTLVTIIVLPPTDTNLPPVAVNDVTTTPINTQVCVPVLANDFDPLGGNSIFLTNFEATSVNGGTILQSGEQLCYTPPTGFTGLDSLTYIICDNGSPVLCDTGTVVITVGTGPMNNPPLAVDDNYVTAESTPITVNILANDSDPDGDLITITFLSDPMFGTVTDAGGGNITYAPDAGATGIDFFSYIICDNGSPTLCDTAYVTITIQPGPPVPFEVQPDIAVTAPETPVVIDILDNDIGFPLPATIVVLDNPDLGVVTIDLITGLATYTPNAGEQDTTDYFVYQVCNAAGLCDSTLVTIIILPLDMTNECPNAGNDTAFTPEDTQVCINVLANDSDAFGGNILALVTFEQPTNGTVIFQPDSTLCYQPNTGFCGLDSFTYVICDNGLAVCCDTATVVVNVCAGVPGNHPPLAENDVSFTDFDVPVVINILANDSDPDDDDLTVTFISEPCGIAVLNADGASVTYTPLSGCGPVDYFSYVICDDGSPVLCDTAYVTITIIGPPPPDHIITETTPEDTPILICVTDPVYGLDFGNLTPAVIVVDTPPLNGTVTSGGATCITYTPDPDFCGEDTFILTVCDESGACVPVTVNMTVTCVPDAPVAVDDAGTTPENTPITIPVLANDYDPDDPSNPDAVVLMDIVDEPTNGIAVIVGDSISYTPNPDFTGCDTFSYIIQAIDDLLTDTAQVVVCVTPDTTAQIIVIAVNDNAETLLNTLVTIPVLDNDTYPGEGLVTVSILTLPLNGTATAVEQSPNNWAINYTPGSGFTGVDSLQYILCETPAGSTEAVCDTAWVFINVASCELLFASGFSPNEDGINDTYIISNLDNLSECFVDAETEMMIFNRWGDVVYQQINYSNDDPWDGTWFTNGEPVPDGTYFYYFVVRNTAQGELFRKQGYIELHR